MHQVPHNSVKRDYIKNWAECFSLVKKNYTDVTTASCQDDRVVLMYICVYVIFYLLRLNYSIPKSFKAET